MANGLSVHLERAVELIKDMQKELLVLASTDYCDTIEKQQAVSDLIDGLATNQEHLRQVYDLLKGNEVHG